jgi:uncharacterized damage-inducible protein DinB
MNAEINHYLARIEDLRGQIASLIADLPADALNWRPIEGGDDHAMNTVAVLASHTAGAERFWIHEVIGRQPPTRVRDNEFETVVESSAPLLEKITATGQETRRILSALTPDALDATRDVRDRTVPVRWAILHVIDHTALHLGHMQITYQLWRGGQGVDAPRWFQRLHPS